MIKTNNVSNAWNPLSRWSAAHPEVAAATVPTPPTGGRAAQSSSARRRVQACLSTAVGCACERRVRQSDGLATPFIGHPTPPRRHERMDSHQPGTSTAKSPKVEQGTWGSRCRDGPPSHCSEFSAFIFVRTTPIRHHCLPPSHKIRVPENSSSVHSNAYRLPLPGLSPSAFFNHRPPTGAPPPL
ncbi:hypothetical protein LZ32DRAFT_130767 [Colletotrichum eremochloae]|nr:hypothetical protein LZ32DRAFT_130767 [Colletotrichum eremochloae]